MIKRFVVLWILTLTLPVYAGVVGGDVNAFIGKKDIDDDTLKEVDVDSQTQFGVAVSLDFDWPVQLAIDLLSSSEDNSASYTYTYPTYTYTYTVSVDVETLELDVGVRKYWGEKARPFVGGGLSYIKLDGNLSTRGRFDPPGTGPSIALLDDSDEDFGYWVGGGFSWTVGAHFNVGVDLRYSDASASLQPREISPGQPPPKLKLDSGGFQYGLLLGYRW